ncbi:Arc family DNA-binding protein [Comamonas testosteroni]|uniref:Arc family DNA-binding protein n=1 Tax=Comamonas testosteroni TaxID=285 RepID=UPI0005B4CB37
MGINQTQADWQRTGLRLPRDLHQQVHEAAKEDDRTFNSQIVAFLRECVEARLARRAIDA